MRHALSAALALLSLAACSTIRPATGPAATLPPIPSDAQVPPFARLAYAPFTRADTIAIALREWRVFNSPVDDDPPGTHPPNPDGKPERAPGLWQRVGEYWWLGQDANNPTAGWTGKHDGGGRVFSVAENGRFPWSAAFISYLFRIAGAGDRFPYAPAHADYINAARRHADGDGNWVLTAERPERYAPVPGDLICYGRGTARGLTFDDLPAPSFPGHCDLVVQATPGELTVLGGNVDDAVTMKHVPTTAGLLTNPATGTATDPRYPWFVVLRVSYDA